MLTKEGAIRTKEQHRAIERATVFLNDPNHEMRRCLACRGSQATAFVRVQCQCALVIAPKYVSSLRIAHTHARTKIEPLWIAGDKGFGKDYKFGTRVSRLGGQLLNL